MSFWNKIKAWFTGPTLKVQFEQLLEKEEVKEVIAEIKEEVIEAKEEIVEVVKKKITKAAAAKPTAKGKKK
jgi:phage terminase small subunit